MSQQFTHIPALLNKQELEQIERTTSTANFVDGRITANLAAKEVKNNLQIDAADEQLQNIYGILLNALQSSPLFQAVALPNIVHPFIISKYTPGKYYGWHVDSPIMGDPMIRTDMAMTVFLSDPTYV
jgi:PKHD-type hydroxylase